MVELVFLHLPLENYSKHPGEEETEMQTLFEEIKCLKPQARK